MRRGVWVAAAVLTHSCREGSPVGHMEPGGDEGDLESTLTLRPGPPGLVYIREGPEEHWARLFMKMGKRKLEWGPASGLGALLGTGAWALCAAPCVAAPMGKAAVADSPSPGLGGASPSCHPPAWCFSLLRPRRLSSESLPSHPHIQTLSTSGHFHLRGLSTSYSLHGHFPAPAPIGASALVSHFAGGASEQLNQVTPLLCSRTLHGSHLPQ